MDRGFPPTQTARTMRERVEARRARQHEDAQHSYEVSRDALNDRPRTGKSIPSFKFELPFATNRHTGRSMDRSTFAGRSAKRDKTIPVKLATGSMAVPRRYDQQRPGLWGDGERGGRGRGSGRGGRDKGRLAVAASFVASCAVSLADGWRELDPDLKKIVKMAGEFVIAMIVVAGLGIGLFANGERPVKATNGAAGGAPTLAALPVAVKPSEPVRILLLGSDMRTGDTGFRTDVMLLLTIDASQGKVSVLSFPRDLVGKIPGYGDSRINTVMGLGGFSLVQDTFEDSYGVRPQHYFLINFEGFVGLINSIGGIEIKAAEFLEDSCDLPQSRAGICKIEPGQHSMDGATALWYVRSRHSSSDFDRLRRAQEVMAGIFDRMMNMQAVARLPELYLQYSQDVETNMTIPQIAGLLPTAIEIGRDPQQIERYAIPSDMTANWVMPDGAMVLLPDYEAVKNYVRDAALIK